MFRVICVGLVLFVGLTLCELLCARICLDCCFGWVV